MRSFVRLHVPKTGAALALYQEQVDLDVLGVGRINRASYVEAKEHLPWWALRQRWRLRRIPLNSWYVDLSPSDGPILGPFSAYSMAVQAEVTWLRTRLGV